MAHANTAGRLHSDGRAAERLPSVSIQVLSLMLIHVWF